MCFLVQIISQMPASYIINPEMLFLKQLVIFLSTSYLHPLQSFASEKQTVKFYNAIINSLINENNVFVLKACLNFVHN